MLLAADHQAVTALEPPHAARRSNVHIMDAPLGAFPGAPDVILEEAVAAIDDHVARLRDRPQLGHRLLGWRARRHHHPEDAGRLELRRRIFKGVGSGSAIRSELLNALGVAVEADDVMAAAHQSAGDVRPHATQANHRKSHPGILVTASMVTPTGLEPVFSP